MPNTGRGKTRSRLEMKIEAGSRNVSSSAEVRKISGNVRLVRTLVLGKADVPIDPKERASARPGICNNTRTDSVEHRSNICDEAQERTTHRFLESLLVFSKPFSVVIVFQFS